MPKLRNCALAAICIGATLFLPSAHRWQTFAQAACAAVPFTDVPANLCTAVSALYYTGITLGTSATTYAPNDNVTRGQMALFLSRDQDQTVKRSRRGVMGWFYTPQAASNSFTTIPGNPTGVSSDGVDLWVASGGLGTVTRVRASDGRVLETWTGAPSVSDVLAINGKVYASAPTSIYVIDPTQPAGVMTKTAELAFQGTSGLAFDGVFLWRVSGVNAVKLTPTGLYNSAVGPLGNTRGVVFDGTSTWVVTSTSVRKNSASGLIFDNTDIPGGFSAGSGHPCFDGVNLIIPDAAGNRLVIVRANSSQVIGTITGNGLTGPTYATFDGERVLVFNTNGTVSVFRASDFSALGVINLAGGIFYQGASDGLNTFVLDASNNRLYRF